MEKNSALTQLAAELIGQGLYDFAAITVVGCGAMIAYLSIDVVAYQAMTLNCIGAISAALAGGVFRETARAASTMKAIHEQEQKMKTMLAQRGALSFHSFDDENDRKESEPTWYSTTTRAPSRSETLERKESVRSTMSNYHLPPNSLKQSLVEEMALDFICHSNDTQVEEMQDSQDQSGEEQSGVNHQSFGCSTTAPNRLQGASTPEAVATFDRYLSTSSQQIIDNRKIDNILPMEMSLRAFDDGDRPEKSRLATETLGVVSVIGGEPVDYDLERASPSKETTRGLSPPPRTLGRARTVKRAWK